MFGGRLLMIMACKTMCRPTFKITQSFASMTPIYTYLWNQIKINDKSFRKSIVYTEQFVDKKFEGDDYEGWIGYGVRNGY